MTTTPHRESWDGEFRCEVEPDRETVRVLPRGELDLDTIKHVEERLLELVHAGFAEVVLDLRHLTFMDSTGLHLILKTARVSRRNGTRFVLIRGTRPVQRLFELVGVDELLTFRDD